MKRDSKDHRRLFFGLSIDAPWPSSYPAGRVIDEKDRHITIAFLGNTDYDKLKSCLHALPKFPPIPSPAGFFYDYACFPSDRRANVFVYRPRFICNDTMVHQFQSTFTKKLLDLALLKKSPHRSFVPHVTMCRKPFDRSTWVRDFAQRPFVVRGFYLYESIGHLQYQQIWSQPIHHSIEKISDITYLVRGQDIRQLFLHAMIALAFKNKKILRCVDQFIGVDITNINDLTAHLNHLIKQTYSDLSCVIKETDNHGHIIRSATGLNEMEMKIEALR